MNNISKKNIIMLLIVITLFVAACDQNVGKELLRKQKQNHCNDFKYN